MKCMKLLFYRAQKDIVAKAISYALLAIPVIARADNCRSLNDCYDVVAAAILAAMAIAAFILLFPELLGLAVVVEEEAAIVAEFGEVAAELTAVAEEDAAIVAEFGEASAATTERSIFNTIKGKIPSEWGKGLPNNKGIGWRWWDSKGNGVRIDKGNPLSQYPTQQVDHVIVRYRGRVIGPDGSPISGSIQNNPIQAHIPIEKYKTWTNWFKP
jgi:hypothetical protein